MLSPSYIMGITIPEQDFFLDELIEHLDNQLTRLGFTPNPIEHCGNYLTKTYTTDSSGTIKVTLTQTGAPPLTITWVDGTKEQKHGVIEFQNMRRPWRKMLVDYLFNGED